MKPSSLNKYKAFKAVDLPNRTWPDNTISSSPIWCSVDLRDGNQALAVPMNVSQKLELFELLVEIGFKEIEIGFPSASETEFNFVRKLVEDKLIPSDVRLQCLVQAREHLIKKTFEAIEGVPNAIVHIYNSTSPLQREITFGGASKDDIKKIAIEGTAIIKELVDSVPETTVDLEYSPESFSDTELEFSLEVCEGVMDVWQPTPEKPIILNLPATVEWTTPNVHADQIEWFCQNLKNRESVKISLHTHNDRGTGTAATELGIMAGADRVEGTLFGNGERTGNLDIATVALNMNSHGIETGLDFSDIPKAREIYERCTQMKVPDRHPYAGDLVFTAFSGSHQDAIKKGMDRIGSSESKWAVPYLTIDPTDIGRTYEAIIRINSQSGKGGIAYILDREYGFDIPKPMQPIVGSKIYKLADSKGMELTNQEILDAFKKEFVNVEKSLCLNEYEILHNEGEDGQVCCKAKILTAGKEYEIKGAGNGPINAFVNALESVGQKSFKLTDYRSHAIKGGSDADSAAYIFLEGIEGDGAWGCGVDPSIEIAGVKALVSALNLLKQD
ncbi:MAG: 2-isopropylmalate synthase [Verrucomicrobiales bacterium]|nr:2-isopropylmalate synthase [Verrucomicrobiales bacterium]MBV63105.1 2-isopropylmalate synthase [Rickettsiales bacterium]|tara:strand:+ start:4049 stop:5722 length:1674 start_codon:yes stop_codon:yes gene_type:complete